jgi:cob(I)alamin adenosyltransferase
MKIYTKSGDKGFTSLFDGSRVEKYSSNINLLGELDELNARIGIIISQKENKFLSEIQKLIFTISSEIANPNAKLEDYSDFVIELEKNMDEMYKYLDELRNFILPGGSIVASNIHLCRTQTRKCERLFFEIGHKNKTIGKFLNRLSDYFFVLARFENKKLGIDDIIWAN